MTTYITFGPDHADLHPHVGTGLNRGYVAISTGDRSARVCTSVRKPADTARASSPPAASR